MILAAAIFMASTFSPLSMNCLSLPKRRVIAIAPAKPEGSYGDGIYTTTVSVEGYDSVKRTKSGVKVKVFANTLASATITTSSGKSELDRAAVRAAVALSRGCGFIGSARTYNATFDYRDRSKLP